MAALMERDARQPGHLPRRVGAGESFVAREAWRSMKNNAVALSFGYLATKTRSRRDGIQDLLEIDLFEITVAPGPANPETRFLNLKTAGDGRISTDAELRSEASRARARRITLQA